MTEENKDVVYVGLEKVPLKTEREENKKKKRHVVVTIFLSILFLLIGFAVGIYYVYSVHPTNRADSANTIGEIEAMLDRYWIYSDNYENLQTELEDKAFYGMTSFDEDPYTTYMSNEELKEFSDGINMDYVGIGVVYRMQNDNALIERVIVNSPAEQAGIQAGDIISKVDGVSIVGYDSAAIKEKVLGEEGTQVIITVIRDGKEIDVPVIRASVDNSVYCYTEDDYIVMELSSFGNSTAKDCMSYLDNFNDYKKIIVDIRSNSGGYQSSVKEIAGLFVGDNQVYLRQKDSKGNEKADYTSCLKTYDFDKIVILMNGDTASAAEVFAICLKEHLPNVTLVGETTFGKGVIQTTHYLLNGGVLKFSSYYWYSPNGVSIHEVGVEPDVEVMQDDIVYEYYEDMYEDETYEYDSVSDQIRIAEMGLDFLGYQIDREDGYFDKSFEEALIEYKNSHDLDNNAILDKDTYDSIISNIILSLSDKENDIQLKKAVELIKE